MVCMLPLQSGAPSRAQLVLAETLKQCCRPRPATYPQPPSSTVHERSSSTIIRCSVPPFEKSSRVSGGLEVVAEAGSVAEAIACLAHYTFDVAIVDLVLPDARGFAFVDHLMTARPAPPNNRARARARARAREQGRFRARGSSLAGCSPRGVRCTAWASSFRATPFQHIRRERLSRHTTTGCRRHAAQRRSLARHARTGSERRPRSRKPFPITCPGHDPSSSTVTPEPPYRWSRRSGR